MFGRRKERDNLGKIGNEATSRELGIEAIPPRPPMRIETGTTPPRGSETLRRLPEITAPSPRRSEARLPIESESKRLHVGREIVLTGEIKACDRLVVEGRVEATLTDIRVIELAESGVLKGSARIETADIAGHFEGELTVQGRLHIRPTGRVHGTIRYGSIEIERGGTIGGQVEALPPARSGIDSLTPPATSGPPPAGPELD
jgi:cytoskeletal protein CcmA (bactofilin family)